MAEYSHLPTKRRPVFGTRPMSCGGRSWILAVAGNANTLEARRHASRNNLEPGHCFARHSMIDQMPGSSSFICYQQAARNVATENPTFTDEIDTS